MSTARQIEAYFVVLYVIFDLFLTQLEFQIMWSFYNNSEIIFLFVLNNSDPHLNSLADVSKSILHP